MNIRRPEADDTILDWWLDARRAFTRENKRGFDTLVIAAVWALWKQRNARVFNRTSQQKTSPELADAIMREVQEWRTAGVGVGGLTRFVRK